MVVRTVIDDIQRIVSVITAQIVCQKGKTKRNQRQQQNASFLLIVVKDVVFPITKSASEVKQMKLSWRKI